MNVRQRPTLWAKPAAGYDRRWRRYERVTLSRLLASLQSERYRDVLDVGCGTGLLLEYLLACNPRPRGVGIDQSREMLDIARRRLAEYDVELRPGEAERLPVADCSMDLVTLASVLHYVKRPSAVCAEARRVLRPGGTLAIVDYVPRGVGGVDFGSVADGLIRLYDHGHVRSRRPAELRAILAHTDLRVARFQSFPIDFTCDGVLAIARLYSLPAALPLL